MYGGLRRLSPPEEGVTLTAAGKHTSRYELWLSGADVTYASG